MLTLEKIRVYESFGGDIDGYARAHGDASARGVTDDEWRLIERLRQSLYLVASHKASDRFSAQLERELQAATADEPAREALRRLSMRESATGSGSRRSE